MWTQFYRLYRQKIGMELNVLYSLSNGVTSEFSGVESEMTSWNTENANSTVTPNDTFSPASGGNQYTCTMFHILHLYFYASATDRGRAKIRPTQQLHKINSAFHLSGVGKLNTGCPAGVKVEHVRLCRVAGNTPWSHMAAVAL